MATQQPTSSVAQPSVVVAPAPVVKKPRIPTVNRKAFAALSRRLPTLQPGSLGPINMGPPKDLAIWTLPTAEGIVRARLVAAMLKFDELSSYVTVQGMSWACSLVSVAFPELADEMVRASPNIIVTAVRVPAAVLAACDPAMPGETTVDATRFPEVAPTAPMKALEDLVIPKLDTVVPWEVYAHLAILLFTLGKVITDQNLRSVTDRRPRALAGVAGEVASQTGFLSQGMLPTVERIRQFRAAMRYETPLFEVVVRGIIRWVSMTESIDLNRRMVALTCRLWDNAGLTHIQIIADLIENYGDAVLATPGLCREANRFVADYNALLGRNDALIGYTKILRPYDNLVRSQDYPELFKIGLEIQRRTTASFRNYATGVQGSAWWKVFESNCAALDYELPEANDPAARATA